MGTLWQDLRYGLRMLLKSPGFTFVAVLSLALGIGINTSIFSLVNAVLLRSVPVVKQPERLVWFRAPASYPNFEDYRDQNDVFSGITAANGTNEFSLSRGGEPELLLGEYVTSSYFDVLGVRAARGRTFQPEEDRAGVPIVVISQHLWQSRFASDPAIVGSEISLNGMAFKVVGVAPQGFIGTEVGLNRELWIPLSMFPQLNPPVASADDDKPEPDMLHRRDTHWLNIIARLKPGVTREQAEAAMMTVAARLNDTYHNREKDEALRSVGLIEMSGGLDPRDRQDALPFAGLSMAVVALVLLIACANVASLLLARAALRQRETAVRQALGASRLRLIRQWLTESMLLAFVGGATGLLFALWTNDVIRAYASTTPLAALDLSLDPSVLAFTFIVSVLTGIVFGLAPALQVSRHDLTTALRGESTLPGMSYRKSRLRRAFVITQVTLSVVLLIGASLFIRSLRGAQSINPGFRIENALTVPVDLGLLRYSKQRGGAFYQELIERTKAQPGVESASLMRFAPLGFSFAQREIVAADGERSMDRRGIGTGFNIVGAEYFKTMGIRLMRGREFTPQDREGAPGVVVVNETLAKRLWPNEDPIGKRVNLEEGDEKFLEVVGVAQDGKYASLGERARPFAYQPLAQSYQSKMTLVVRTIGDSRGVSEGVRNKLRALNADLPVIGMKTLAEQVDLSLFPARIAAMLLGSFGLLALLLAGVGMYGIVSYSVNQRTQEIGIRMALGARREDVLRMVLSEGLLIVGVGIVTGLVLSFIVTRLVASFLYGVSPTDFVTFTIIPLLLASVALLASFIPARRATKVDPMVALRYE